MKVWLQLFLNIIKCMFTCKRICSRAKLLYHHAFNWIIIVHKFDFLDEVFQIPSPTQIIPQFSLRSLVLVQLLFSAKEMPFGKRLMNNSSHFSLIQHWTGVLSHSLHTTSFRKVVFQELEKSGCSRFMFRLDFPLTNSQIN